MKRLLFALVIVLACAAPAFALCVVPTPLPSVPLPPVFSIETVSFSDRTRVDIWRQPCEPGSTPGEIALYLRATPITSAPFFCYLDITLIQGSQQIEAILRPAPGDTLCDDLFVPVTATLDRSSGPAFDNKKAFTFIYDGGGDGFQQIDIPDAGPAFFGVKVVITGCNPCKVGDFAQLHLHVTNPGPGRHVEVKSGSHFPDGGVFAFLGRYVEMFIPSGESDILIPELVLPGYLPLGTYTIEAALLEPDFGTTLSRHSVTANLNP